MTTSSRREFLEAGALALAGIGIGPLSTMRLLRRVDPEVIEMRSDALGAHAWFDPVGLHVEPGTTVRWIVRENVHTTTAYHPQNDHHSLRMPAEAVPWDSGYLVRPGEHFDVTLSVPGVYDYYCLPHEAAGMVGRIVVGTPPGPAAAPLDPGSDTSGAGRWRQVPDAARATFPGVARILAERRVRPAGQGG